MNNVYNETAIREATFVINGRDGSSFLSIVGRRCGEDCGDYLDPVNDTEVEEVTNLWSDPATWKDLPDRIPLPDEDVVIPSGYNVIYDIGDSPLYKSLEINGRLTFLAGSPAKINSFALWVRAGILEAGNATHPFDSTIEFMLHGNNSSPSAFVFAPNIQVGNKNFIVTGTVNLFGTRRSTSSRLLS